MVSTQLAAEADQAFAEIVTAADPTLARIERDVVSDVFRGTSRLDGYIADDTGESHGVEIQE